MMKQIFFLLSTILCTSFAFSSDSQRLIMQVNRIASETDSTLSENQAVYIFKMNNLLTEDSDAFIQYSVDSANYEAQLEGTTLRIETTPGLHNFQLYINSNYYEVFASYLTIGAQQIDTYEVNWFHRLRRVEDAVTYKPVIYLYPEEEKEIEVAVTIDGTNPFYYPTYNNGWKVVAQPDGSLQVNGEQFRYLFWEATQKDHLSQIVLDEGFVVHGDNASTFLENTLKEVGFTSEERADFITFWGPKLAANELNLVRFEWNNTCDKFAALDITPKPDNTFRFYIFTTAIDTHLSLTPQELPIFNREGFTVLEWGGQQSNINIEKSL